MDGFAPVSRAFFEHDVFQVAPTLLGGLLRRSDGEGTVAIRVTEVEAYAGERDPGAHAFRGPTKRNATMFGPAGHVYCYFSYGLHHAVNLVTTGTGRPYGCLVRAGEVVEGLELARRRRLAGRSSALADRDLARGPGRVAQALGATLADDGADLFGGPWAFLAPVTPAAVATGPRVGVSGEAGQFPWRYWIPGDPTVSAYRPGRAAAPRAPQPR
jgi:DNA-3-methyladenine glycosylase